MNNIPENIQSKPYESNESDLKTKLREIEEFPVPQNILFFTLQNTGNTNELTAMGDSDFSKLFNEKKVYFSSLKTEIFNNITDYYDKLNSGKGIIYCLKNIPNDINNLEANPYRIIVASLKEKLDTISKEEVAELFFEYFIKRKNEYIGAKNKRNSSPSTPLNYIKENNKLYKSTLGAEIKLPDSTTVKVTQIMLHDIINLFSHRATFFSGYDYNLPMYEIGKPKFIEFINNFACSIAITKMFFDKDDTGKTY